MSLELRGPSSAALSSTYAARDMQAALAAAANSRVGRAAVLGWEPSSMGGVSAWFRADTLAALGDGAAVTSWADKTGTITVTQATAGKQPILKTGANGMNNQPVVRFAAASSQILSASGVSTLPSRMATGGFSILMAFRPTILTTPAQQIVGYAPTAGNGGWVAGYSSSGGTLEFTTAGVKQYDFPRGFPVNTPGQATIVANSDFSVTANRNLYNNNNGTFEPTVTGTTDAIGSPSVFDIGGRSVANGDYANVDVAEIVVVNRPISYEEKKLWARYCATRYGMLASSEYHAANYLTIPTYDGSGRCTEPSVLYFPNGFKGRKHWMAFVPFANGDPAFENPSVVVSDDGLTWTAPAGLTNPIIAPRGAGTGNNADPRLRVFDGTFYLYYVVGADPTLANDGIYVVTSTDGVTWSAPSKILASADTASNSVLEPTVVYDKARGKYVLYTVNAQASPNVLERRTSSTPVGPWSTAQPIKTPVPGNRVAWHIDIIIDATGIYRMSLSDGPSGSVRNFWLASSSDGVSWTVSPWPIMQPSINGWDNGVMYRASFALSEDGSAWRIWYGASASGGTLWNIGYTTVPAYEFP